MSLREDLLKTTEELIRFRSTEDRPDQIQACADYIARFFDGTDLVVERFEFGGVPSVVVTKGTKSPTVFLNGHFDVVEGEDGQFEPRVENGTLFGRGALDMKSGDAALMHVMRDLAKTDHDVGLMLTGDEEVGGFHGVAKLVEEGYRCDVAVIPDGGEAIQNMIEKGKGVLHVTLEASGENAHGSMPWQGENAINRLVKAIEKVTTLFVPLSSHPADHWETTCNVGKISGGVATNQVPSFAHATLDIRYIENDTPAEILSRIKAILPEGVSASSTAIAPVVVVPLEHPLVQAFANQVKAEGREAIYSLDHGASDGRFFSEKGTPVIISQPDGGLLHAPGEWVDIASIETYYRVVKGFVETVA